MIDDPGRNFTRDFDTGYQTVVRITVSHLVVLAGTDGCPEYPSKAEYPLPGIVSVRETGLPGGQSAVAIALRDRDHNPGLTFKNSTTATAFTDALSDTIDGTFR